MTRVLITGVRGKTGAPLAQALAARPGVEVLGGSSDPSTVTADGVRPVAFSWDDPSGWAAATAGADAVFLVRPDREDAPELVAGLVAGTDARVVLLSEREYGSAEVGEWALRVEAAVRDGARAWAILRPSWFMQVFTDDRFYRADLAEHGRLRFSAAGARVAWIDARDIAAVAEQALLDPAHDGAVLELTGPEALTLEETAAALEPLAGRPVTYEEVTIDTAVEDLPEGFERDEFVWTLERLQAGEYAGVTDAVERVTGRPARRLADLA